MVFSDLVKAVDEVTEKVQEKYGKDWMEKADHLKVLSSDGFLSDVELDIDLEEGMMGDYVQLDVDLS